MNKTFDRYASIVLMAFGTMFAWQSTKISASAYGSVVGPNVFPFGLGLILVALSAGLLYGTFRYKQEEREKTPMHYKKFWIIVFSLTLYCVFLEQIGYVIGTFLFLLVGFQAMQRGNVWKSAIIAAVFSFVIYYLYAVLLNGTLPGWPVWFTHWRFDYGSYSVFAQRLQHRAAVA
ncbi:tripartite tricarboxylate transporter TctB family protein [Ferviditalea candida]|uniref:Tripartite tricarboxylate transporter TctB family protein n=1 Tax=Ferviditalea candida TaxID=3108399 RepID=A0ABU5ZPI0_9BACL|nr:tripartite tricarboxylate transporter TctB family protein [Paenibacillaceae bacterium T2]